MCLLSGPAVFLALPNAGIAQSGECILPIEGPVIVTNGPGEGWHFKGSPSAEAIDLSTGRGTPVCPCKPGTVEFAGVDDSGFGKLVKIRHEDGSVSYYAHLGSIFVRPNQVVGHTTKLGAVNCTGRCTGNHLHFELRSSTEEAESLRHLVTWNSGCPPCDDPSGSADGPSRHIYVVDSFFMDSRDSSARSRVVLRNGQQYIVTVAGSFSLWAPSQWRDDGVCGGTPDGQPLLVSLGKFNGPVGADFEFHFAYPGRSTACQESLAVPTENGALTLSLDGGGSYYNPRPTFARYNREHIYQYSVMGTGTHLIIRLEDNFYIDNYGQFVVNVEEY